MNPGKAAASAVFHGFDVEVQSFMKEQLWTERLEEETEAIVQPVSRAEGGAGRFSQIDTTILYNMTPCRPKVGFSGPGIGCRPKSPLRIRSRTGGKCIRFLSSLRGFKKN
jgi:hypothetical protein